MFFSLVTKNSKWEILTKNLVFLKKDGTWVGKDEKWGFTEKFDF